MGLQHDARAGRRFGEHPGALVAGVAARQGCRRAVGPDDGADLFDPARFKQVLYNYLSNAVKFTPRGGSVSVRIALEENACFRPEVEAQGGTVAVRSTPGQGSLFSAVLPLHPVG
jgi:signal transduction histidine kinase